MHNSLAAASLVALAVLVAPAYAGTLIPVVPVPGSSETNVYGISDSNEITGNYDDSNGIQHGFAGTLGGNYTVFDYTIKTVDGTAPRALNNAGWINGSAYATNEGLRVGYEFVRDPNGRMITIKKDGVPLDGIAQGITRKGLSVGDYWTVEGSRSVRLGYYAKKGKYSKDMILAPDIPQTEPRGINRFAVVVGYFQNANHFSGFFLQGDTTSQIDYPDANAINTYLEGINDNGLATGAWDNRNGSTPAFLFDSKTNTFTPFDVPGAVGVWLGSPNNAGFFPVGSDIGSFVYCPKRKSECPGNGIEIRLGKGIHLATHVLNQITPPADADAPIRDTHNLRR